MVELTGPVIKTDSRDNFVPRRLIETVGLAILLALITTLCISTWPILDRTEARVLVLAKNIQETTDWFSLYLQNNGVLQKYWAKPPFHYWLVSLALESKLPLELAGRLPALGSMILVFILTAGIASLIFNRSIGEESLRVLATSALFFFVMPLALIDSTLTAALTSFLACFLFGASSKNSHYRYILFVAAGLFLGVALMTKGLVAIALPCTAILLHFLLGGRPLKVKALEGAVVFLSCAAISIPFFIVVEIHNPGFNKYFFLNENILRYLSADFGAQTGSGHKKPYGVSLLFFLVSIFPWTLLLPRIIKRYGRRSTEHDWRKQFLFCWSIAPAVFFIFARQHLATYLLPGIPAFAILVAHELESASENDLKKLNTLFGFLLLLVPICVFGSMLFEAEKLILLAALVIGAIALVMRLQTSKKMITPRHITVPLFFAFASMCLSLQHLVEDSASTRDILKAITSESDGSNTVIEFPQGIPYSAYLYSKFPIREDSHAKNSSTYFILTRRGDIPSLLRGEVFGKDQKIIVDGKWDVTRETLNP